jgi:hypothetical protein
MGSEKTKQKNKKTLNFLRTNQTIKEMLFFCSLLSQMIITLILLQFI